MRAVGRGRSHDGKVVLMASSLRRLRSPGRRPSGQPIIHVLADDNARLASMSSAGTDWEIIAWKAIAIANAGIAGSDLRDMMLEAVEKRFAAIPTRRPMEWLSGNGAPCTAVDIRRFAAQLAFWPASRPGPASRATA